MKQHKAKDEVTLEKLSDELLSNVFSHLPRDNRLASVALVSRRFNALVEGFLYDNIRLEIKFMPQDLETQAKVGVSRSGFERFDRLIQHLKANPRLSFRVKSLSLVVHHSFWYEPVQYHTRLLRHLPFLQYLSLSPPPVSNGIPEEVKDNALDFLRLNFRNVQGHFDRTADWHHGIESVLILASHLVHDRALRTIHVEASEKEPPNHCGDNFWGRAQHQTSSVVDLRFVQTCYTGGILAYILSIIRQLKCLTINCEPKWQSESHPVAEAVRLSGVEFLTQVINTHRDSLEELTMATSRGHFIVNFVPLSTFRAYTHLRRLAVQHGLLNLDLLHEALPPQLEELQFQYTLHDFRSPSSPQPFLESLQRLAKYKESYVPQLRLLVWWYQPHHEYSFEDHGEKPIKWDWPGLEDLGKDFAKLRVKFEWLSRLELEDTPLGEHLKITSERFMSAKDREELERPDVRECRRREFTLRRSNSWEYLQVLESLESRRD